jgi:hypothetical protein
MAEREVPGIEKVIPDGNDSGADILGIDTDIPDTPDIPDTDTPGIPDTDTPDIPDTDTPDIPDTDTPGMPDIDTTGIPDTPIPGGTVTDTCGDVCSSFGTVIIRFDGI